MGVRQNESEHSVSLRVIREMSISAGHLPYNESRIRLVNAAHVQQTGYIITNLLDPMSLIILNCNRMLDLYSEPISA